MKNVATTVNYSAYNIRNLELIVKGEQGRCEETI